MAASAGNPAFGNTCKTASTRGRSAVSSLRHVSPRSRRSPARQADAPYPHRELVSVGRRGGTDRGIIKARSMPIRYQRLGSVLICGEPRPEEIDHGSLVQGVFLVLGCNALRGGDRAVL